MKVIGITGGAGAGKSQLINYVEKHYHCEVLLADEIAHRLQEPGEPCYLQLIALLGRDILQEDGRIDRSKMAALIFQKKKLLAEVNKMIHPAVKKFIEEKIEKERKKEELDFMFVEAALLIEEKYEKILDEIWYIYADDDCRRERLRKTRGYSDEKISRIFQSQLTEAEFRKSCKVVIDNGNSIEDTHQQIDKKLEEYLWKK